MNVRDLVEDLGGVRVGGRGGVGLKVDGGAGAAFGLGRPRMDVGCYFGEGGESGEEVCEGLGAR